MPGNNNPPPPVPAVNPSVVQIVISYDRITKQVQYSGPLEDYVTLLGMLDMARLVLIEARRSSHPEGPRLAIPTPLTRR